MTGEELARMLYAAFVRARGGLTPEGGQAPGWEQLAEEDRQAWRAVANAAAQALTDVSRPQALPVPQGTAFVGSLVGADDLG